MTNYSQKGAPKTKPNYVYSIISVTLVLFLLGFFGLVLIQAQNLITSLKERVNVLVELKENTSKAEIDSLQYILKTSSFTKEGTLQFISKEEAAKILREDFGKDFLTLDLPNPLYDVFSFNVIAAYMQADSLDQMRQMIKNLDFVGDVYYQENLVNEIAANIKKIGYISLGIGVFFLFVAFALIHNTIRLALYANRFLIKNMELVGASWRFISRPYILRSIKHGFISGILAVAALVILLYLAQKDLSGLRNLQDIHSFAVLFSALLLLGILISAFSTYYVVKKYLKLRVDDLY